MTHRTRSRGVLGLAGAAVALSALAIGFVIQGCPDPVEPLGPHENTAAMCRDGTDNDNDLLIDCDDPDCTVICYGGDGDGDGDGDADGDGDGDGDADGDGDGDADSDADLDGDAEIEAECTAESDCALAYNYRVCCLCPEAVPTDRIGTACMVAATGAPSRPDGCLPYPDACHPEICPECVQPAAATCAGGRCVERYTGDCVTDDDCGDGRLCQVVDGAARCVDDPSSCRTTADCERSGWECRDWLSDGVRFCWSPDSACFDDMSCYFGEFCEDPESDGVYACVRHEGECLVGRDVCPEGVACNDPDGDGRGTCP